MGLDLKQLGRDILEAVETVAPLVGLGDELDAGKKAAEAVIRLASNAKSALEPDDQAQLDANLEALIARVKAHADQVREQLK